MNIGVTLAAIVWAALGGTCLAISFIFPEWFALAWIAFVFLLVALKDSSYKQAYLAGLFFGLSFYGSAAHWVTDFIQLFKGVSYVPSLLLGVMFWFYSAQLPALASLLFRFLQNKLHLSLYLVFPATFTVFYAFFPMLFPVQLGESQSGFIIAIQGISFTGVYGLDFMILLVSCLVYRLLTNDWREPATYFSTLLIIVWFGYGYLFQSLPKSNSSALIGIVQSNEVPSLKVPEVQPGYALSYPPELEMTEALARAGAQLVIWPETRFKNYLNNKNVKEVYQRIIEDNGTELIFHDMELIQDDGLEEVNRFSSSIVALNSAGISVGKYDKVKRVAFGERVPFIDDLGWLKNLVTWLFGDFYTPLTPGAGPEVFKMNGFFVAPTICFESMFPIYIANVVSKNNQQVSNSSNFQSPVFKLITVLSSDGWFGNSRQPQQHFNASALRAVENRTTLIHVVNNGPSGVVLPNGELLFKSPQGNAGGYLVEIPKVSSPNSFFSQFPYLFVGFITLWVVLLIVAACLFPIIFERRQ